SVILCFTSDSQWVNTSALAVLEESQPTASHDSLLLLLLVPILISILFLILGIFLCQLNQKRLKSALFKQTLPPSASNRLCTCGAVQLKSDGTLGGSIAQCTCGYLDNLKQNDELDNPFGYHSSGLTQRTPKVGTGWLTPGEIEGLASMITKLELKSQGCFGQVWHGRFVLPSEDQERISIPSVSTVSPTLPAITSSLGDSNQPDSSATRVVDVAVKIFRSAQKDSWQTELSLFRLPGLAHPNILKFYGADQVNDYDGLVPDVQYWLVTEYHPLGSLYDYLHTNTVGWPELLRIAISVARGLTHLHAETTLTNGMDSVMGHPKLSVAHRDLNSRNVLLKQDMSACIADFGLAIRFDPGQFPSVAHPQLGTRRYMAPEVLDGAIQFSRDAYLRIDVYAMGLVFWELMSRCTGTVEHPITINEPYRAPFEAELGPAPTMEELQLFVAHEKQRPRFNPVWADDPLMCTLWETVEECWDQDAEARLSAGCVTKRLATLAQETQVPSDPSGTPVMTTQPRLNASSDVELSDVYLANDTNENQQTDHISLAPLRPIAVFRPPSLNRSQASPNPICLPVPSKCAADAISHSGQLTTALHNDDCDAPERESLLSKTPAPL
ncbi:Receptor protein serine/threonine kinase, partial [Fasciolopsis buskii]